MKYRNRNVHCSAFGCRNADKSSSWDADTLMFFPFPKQSLFGALRKLWIRNCRWQDWEPSRRTVLCSDHFAPECFKVNEDGKITLKENACPTRFNFPAVSKKTKREMELKKKKKTKRLMKKHQNINDPVNVSVVLKRIEIQPLCGYGGYGKIGYIVDVDLPPISLLPFVGPKDISKPIVSHIPHTQGPVISDVRGRCDLPRVQSSAIANQAKIIRLDHNYVLPSAKTLKSRVSILMERYQSQELILRDKRAEALKLKKNVARLQKQLGDMQNMLKKQIQLSTALPPPQVLSVVPEKIKEIKEPVKYPKLCSRKTQTRPKDIYGDGSFSEEEVDDLEDGETTKYKKEMSYKRKLERDRERRKRKREERMREILSNAKKKQKVDQSPTGTSTITSESNNSLEKSQETEESSTSLQTGNSNDIGSVEKVTKESQQNSLSDIQLHNCPENEVGDSSVVSQKEIQVNCDQEDNRNDDESQFIFKEATKPEEESALEELLSSNKEELPSTEDLFLEAMK